MLDELENTVSFTLFIGLSIDMVILSSVKYMIFHDGEGVL
jgi:hypothetical protein